MELSIFLGFPPHYLSTVLPYLSSHTALDKCQINITQKQYSKHRHNSHFKAGTLNNYYRYRNSSQNKSLQSHLQLLSTYHSTIVNLNQ